MLLFDARATLRLPVFYFQTDEKVLAALTAPRMFLSFAGKVFFDISFPCIRHIFILY
jgi:hypothetical protein